MIETVSEVLIDALVRHLARNARESGRDGDAFSRTTSADEPVDEASIATRIRAGLARPLAAVDWQRWWCLTDGGEVRGHVDLRGSPIVAGLHRAQLGIGLERGWRRRGWGEGLMRTALGWAADQGLAWVDLGVFSENAPARALYRKLGFEEVGIVEDAFRVDGTSLDDVAMVFRLPSP